jgi:hypothetical protein
MTYRVGDVFLGCPASFTGRPYNQPTVLHYDADGLTLLHTLTIPVGPAVNEEYAIQGAAVGVDGYLYVIWQTNGHASPLVAPGAWLGRFDPDGSWLGTIVTLSTEALVSGTLFALPGGDLAVTVRPDGGPTTIGRYQPGGTLVGSWAAPQSGFVRGFCRKPEENETALFMVDDQAYVVSLLDGSASSPVTVPYDSGTEFAWALLASRTAPVLVLRDDVPSDKVWYAQTLSTDLTSTTGGRAQLAAESFPGGGVFIFGLVNPPSDAAVNRAGTAGWAVTFNQDNNRSGDPADSLFRTDLRRTIIPDGISSAVQSDLNGDTNLVYVFQGFGETIGPSYFFIW